jgi:hypothetical protein
MANYFYYDSNGVKQGPVSASQLKSLTKFGTIVPNTVIETQDGKQARAENVKGLSFEPVLPPPMVTGIAPPPLPTQSSGFTDPFYSVQNDANPFAQFGNQSFSNQTPDFDFSDMNLELSGYTFPQSTPDPFVQPSPGFPAQPRSTYSIGGNKLATIAFRQHMLIITLYGMILFGTTTRIVIRVCVAPEVAFLLTSIHIALLLIWAPFITFIMRKSLGGSTFASILLCPVGLLPVLSWVYWWSLSRQATVKLRKAGYEVGFWGADMSQFGYGSHDNIPKYFVAGVMSGVVAVIAFFSLVSAFHYLQKLNAEQEAAQQQVEQQQEAAQQQVLKPLAADQQNSTGLESPVQSINPDRRRPSDRMSTLRERLRGEMFEVPTETIADEQSENVRHVPKNLYLRQIKWAEEEYCRNAFIGACACAAMWDLQVKYNPQTGYTPNRIIEVHREEKKKLERQYANAGIDKKVKYAELSKELDKTAWKNQERRTIISIALLSQHPQMQPVPSRPQPVPTRPQPVLPQPRFTSPRQPGGPIFSGSTMSDSKAAETFADNLLNDDTKITSIIEQHFEKE